MTEPHFNDDGLFVHWCQHPDCRKWGSLGFDCHIGRYWQAVELEDPSAAHWLGKWFCGEHAKAHRAALAAGAMAPLPALRAGKTAVAQGSLF